MTIDSQDDIDDLLKAIDKTEKTIQDAFLRAGEAYVSTARVNGSYKDRTGNLRNANSYQVFKSGQPVAGDVSAHTAGLFAKDPAVGDLTLVAGNGMDYASYVEAMGYDVASSGQLAAERVIEEQAAKIKV